LLYLPIYFPSVTFGVYPAEIFPWAFLLALFIVRKFSAIDIFLLTSIVISSIYGAFKGAETFEVFRGLGSYLNFFAAYLIAKQAPSSYFKRILSMNKIIFYVFIIVGFLQYSGFIPFLDSIIKFFIPRGSAVLLLDLGGRGASLLSSEPARAGVELIFIYLLFRITLPPEKKWLFDIFVLIFLLIIVKSVMALMLYMIFLALTYIKVSLFIIFISVLVPFAGLITQSEEVGRINTFLVEIFNSQINDVFFIIMNSSGHRVLSIWTSFYHGIVYPFGGGVGAWKQTSLNAIELVGYDVSSLRFFHVWGSGSPVSIRSSGIGSSMMLDLGIIYFSIFIYSLHNVIKGIFNLRLRDAFPLYAVFFTKILFIGSVGATVEIFCFIILVRIIMTKNNQFKTNGNIEQV
jgi:hypothetical protein